MQQTEQVKREDVKIKKMQNIPNDFCNIYILKNIWLFPVSIFRPMLPLGAVRNNKITSANLFEFKTT